MYNAELYFVSPSINNEMYSLYKAVVFKICGTLVTTSEFSRKLSPVEVRLLEAKMK
jgi:hypothetical protein